MFEYVACTCKGKGRVVNQDRITVDDIALYEGNLGGRKSRDLVAVEL